MLRHKLVPKEHQVDGVSLAMRARKKLQALVADESRGWGDAGNALHRVARRESIPYSYLRRILVRYRELKDVRTSVFLKLSLAHRAMCERQMRRFQNERDETAAGWFAEDLVGQADSVVGEDEQEETG